MSGESWLAVKDSLTHQSGSQGQAFSGFYFLSDLYFVLFLPFMFYILSGCGGGLGPGGGGLGLLGSGPHQLLFYL